ncbi:glycerophosphodiester phosphodiesterase [Thomasclavelia sp.]
MIKLGHRGYSERYPENTMIAFKKAIEGNFDGIETDVHLTKDNKLVLIHDEKINRTSNGKGYIKDYTYDELCNYNFNYHFKDVNARIPLLEELLDYCSEKDVILNLEIKTDKIHYNNIEQMTYDLVRQKGLLNKVIFSSFYLESLLKLREIDNTLYLGYLFEDNYEINKEIVLKYKFNAAHPKYVFLNEKEINDYHSNGIDVNTWTVNNDEIKDFLFEEGVKIIITNRDI